MIEDWTGSWVLRIGPSSPHYTAGAWAGARFEDEDTYVLIVSMEPGHTSLTGRGELRVCIVAVAVSSRRHRLLRRGGTRKLSKKGFALVVKIEISFLSAGPEQVELAVKQARGRNKQRVKRVTHVKVGI